MSWSFRCIGKPAAVAAAIDAYVATLNGQSQIEATDAAPHLKALVTQNFAVEGSGYIEPVLDFEASGTGATKGSVDDLTQIYRSFTVSIKPLWAKLV